VSLSRVGDLMVDPITDLLNRIRNAGMAQHADTRVPHSKMKSKILEIMQQTGFIEGFSEEAIDGGHKNLIVKLRYIDDSRTAIKSLKRISKPGRRWYCNTKEIPQVKSGLGVAVISTSKGIMTDRDARRLNVGGEVICEIW
jgi:small subunit ribosomal protein S8